MKLNFKKCINLIIHKCLKKQISFILDDHLNRIDIQFKAIENLIIKDSEAIIK